MHPEAGTVDRGADHGEERGQHEDDGNEQQYIAVTIEVPGPLHHQQGEHIEAATEECPGCLLLGSYRVPANDFDVAESVEEGHQRQEDRVGVGDEPSVGQVDSNREAEDASEESEGLGPRSKRGTRQAAVRWPLGVIGGAICQIVPVAVALDVPLLGIPEEQFQ